MSFFEFPHTRTYDKDLGWVIDAMKKLSDAMESFIAANSLAFADPITHDLVKSYQKNTIVIDENGNAFLSLQIVPAGIELSKSDYWLMIFDYEAFLEKVNKNFTGRYYRNENRAKTAITSGDWLTFDDVLCKATEDIAIDDLIVIDGNIEAFTLEDFIKAFMTSANALIQQYKDDIDASELAYQTAMQAEVDRILAGATVDSEVIDARLGANGVNYPTLGNAIRKQIESIRQLSFSIINNDDREQKMMLPDFVSTDIFDLADGSGNIVTKINYRGDIKAPNFDSTRVITDNPVYSPKPYDFIIQDINNNIVFGMLYGKALSNARLHGKKLSIVGDSISTYANYSPGSYYPSGDVDSVRKTWWYMLADELGMEILKNTSRSNTTVTGDSEATDAKPGCSTARINELKDGDVMPDIVICYMSTNDWGQNHEIGTFTSHDEIPSEGVISDICPAYALMLYKIRTTYPDALVYCITNLEGRLHSGDTTYPVENSQGETIHDVNHAITEVAHIFGCHVIDLNTSGIHFWNISDYSLSGTPTHPNAAGMVVIKETVKQKLIETV